MITLLARFFVRDGMSEEDARGAYGILCGAVGIALNILLFAGKCFAGILSHSVAITADAFNNLSDAGSSVVTLVGFHLAAQKPDAEHPYGHGRMEYISGLVVAGAILLMAFELVKESVGKILHPAQTVCSPVVVGILILSIAVKCYMAAYNFRIGKKIDSAALRATGTDSLSDCISTGVVLAATVVGHFTHLQIDGWCGLAVAVLIFLAGINAAKETLDPLLGQPPERSYMEEIENYVTSFSDQIVGVHDLMVHDYGPGRKIISLHAEVPAEGDILTLHDIVDNVEKALALHMGCTATIHMDPVVTQDPKVDFLRQQVRTLLGEIDPIISMHDFRVVVGPTHTNIIFDIVLPFDYPKEEKALKREIRDHVTQRLGPGFFTVIQVDRLALQK